MPLSCCGKLLEKGAAHDTPAYLAIQFCIFTEENKTLYKGRRGAPCMNLLNTFRKCLEKRKSLNNLESLSDLDNLRALA